MPEFKVVTVNISFDMCLLHEDDSKTHQIEDAMDEALKAISPALGGLAIGSNVAIASAVFSTEVEGHKVSYRPKVQQLIKEFMNSKFPQR